MTQAGLSEFNAEREDYFIDRHLQLHRIVEAGGLSLYISADEGHEDLLGDLKIDVESIGLKDLGPMPRFENRPTLQIVIDADFSKFFEDAMKEIFPNAHAADDIVRDLRNYFFSQKDSNEGQTRSFRSERRIGF